MMKLKFCIKEKPLVMGILNVTPDSFSDGGKYSQIDKGFKYVEEMIEEGADIIDIGGESSRPGSDIISDQEEIDRVIPMVEKIRQNLNIPISIDTTKKRIVEEAIKFNIQIINDISAMNDKNILKLLIKIYINKKEIY